MQQMGQQLQQMQQMQQIQLHHQISQQLYALQNLPLQHAALQMRRQQLQQLLDSNTRAEWKKFKNDLSNTGRITATFHEEILPNSNERYSLTLAINTEEVLPFQRGDVNSQY